MRVPSYVDDLGLICHFKTIKENCYLIKKAVEEIIEKGKEIFI